MQSCGWGEGGTSKPAVALQLLHGKKRPIGKGAVDAGEVAHVQQNSSAVHIDSRGVCDKAV